MVCRGRLPMRLERLATSLLAFASLRLVRCYDLFPCQEKPTYTGLSCPVSTMVACWSLHPEIKWLCFQQVSEDWLTGPLPGTPVDVNCRAWPTPSGTTRGFYDGACTFGHPRKVVVPPVPPFPLSWDEAWKKAGETLTRMTDAEKYTLLNGIGWYWPPWNGWWGLHKWYYVGNTAPIPRLGVPSLNMQDSAGGFRPYWHEIVGTVTCWPSQLSLAATWDEGLVRAFSMALGTEFAGKGANVILGPSVNVHRVARGGRNFEYISGEDPYLGSRLVEAWVQGVESQGIMAVVKHWVFNEQETNRDTEDSWVDKKTAWELYYPPFQAAIKAGVSVAMCSYNRENGRHSCANKEQLRILREELGFQGFVQSDWWAMHSMDLPMGTDQDMPGVSDPGIGNTPTCHPPTCLNESAWYETAMLKQQDKSLVETSAQRILASMYKRDLKSSCSPPNCKEWFLRNVTGRSHRALARHIAAESIVMLKNEGVLPLPGPAGNQVRSIAIVGEASVAKPYDPDGAGQGVGVWWKGDYYSGGGSGHIAAAHVVTPLEGISKRAQLAGLNVVGSPSNDTAQAIEAARQCDVTIVVGATTGHESLDRENLHLDGTADELISVLSRASKKLVVLLMIPGAVLTPWRNDAQAILAMFLGGETTGDAWADVLFGDIAPSGRLPVMMPATQADVIEPSTVVKTPYQEGLQTSYRAPNFKAAFPFGFGLTYTKFSYGPAKNVPCNTGPETDICLQLSLQNSGTMSAKCVAQLYLQFPPEAGHPAPFLKGFQKTAVMPPGAKQDLHFRLTDEELRYYDANANGWVRPATVTAHIGESSADIRQTLQLSVPAQKSGKTLWVVLMLILLLGLVLIAVLACRRSRSSSYCPDDVCEEVDSESSSGECSGEDSRA